MLWIPWPRSSLRTPIAEGLHWVSFQEQYLLSPVGAVGVELYVGACALGSDFFMHSFNKHLSAYGHHCRCRDVAMSKTNTYILSHSLVELITRNSKQVINSYKCSEEKKAGWRTEQGGESFSYGGLGSFSDIWAKALNSEKGPAMSMFGEGIFQTEEIANRKALRQKKAYFVQRTA